MTRPVICTTLQMIKNKGPCTRGWVNLLQCLGKTKPDGRKLSLLKILEFNGIKDAIWALGCVNSKYDNALRLFACHCVQPSLKFWEKEYPGDKRPRKAIEAAKKFAHGKLIAKKMGAVREAARNAIWEKGNIFESSCAQMAAWGAVWVATENADEAAWEGMDCVARCAAHCWADEVVWKGVGREARTGLCGNEAMIKAWETAWETAYDAYIPEFKRLCQLEGVYGEVVQSLMSSSC